VGRMGAFVVSALLPAEDSIGEIGHGNLIRIVSAEKRWRYEESNSHNQPLRGMC